jgi:hypothetical protein
MLQDAQFEVSHPQLEHITSHHLITSTDCLYGTERLGCKMRWEGHVARTWVSRVPIQDLLEILTATDTKESRKDIIRKDLKETVWGLPAQDRV